MSPWRECSCSYSCFPRQPTRVCVATALFGGFQRPACAANEVHRYGLLPCRLPASSNPEIFAAQRTLAEAWTIVGESFVDESFNGHDWENELRTHMVAAFKSPDGSTAYKQLDELLQNLGDPYTRRIPPE